MTDRHHACCLQLEKRSLRRDEGYFTNLRLLYGDICSAVFAEPGGGELPLDDDRIVAGGGQEAGAVWLDHDDVFDADVGSAG